MYSETADTLKCTVAASLLLFPSCASRTLFPLIQQFISPVKKFNEFSAWPEKVLGVAKINTNGNYEYTLAVIVEIQKCISLILPCP